MTSTFLDCSALLDCSGLRSPLFSLASHHGTPPEPTNNAMKTSRRNEASDEPLQSHPLNDGLDCSDIICAGCLFFPVFAINYQPSTNNDL
jgi:hypothetical protein